VVDIETEPDASGNAVLSLVVPEVDADLAVACAPGRIALVGESR